ncbi:hypothetical protein B0J17DRAFT_664354 [Rhizoctonia solani]|nr:hypothetical protein B0J17DRAFT_664354 [Rhizoctonia solani]
MERPPSQQRETMDESDTHGQPRRNSFTPSMRRERPILRSSPLAGASFSADGAGNVVEHTSALDEEIARRRTMLPGVNDEDLARLAKLSPSTPALSPSSSPSPSRKGSLETTDESQPRRARPSFISLAPQGSRPGSRDSLVPPTPTSPTLRARHSSPHLAVTAKPSPPDSGPGPANWMTAAPTPSFSRMGVRGSGVIMPVKASSRAGEQIRLKSTPNQPGSITTRPKTQPGSSTKPRSLRSFRSMSGILRGNGASEHDKQVSSMPTSISPSGSRSRASSFEVGVREDSASSSPTSPTTPDDAIDMKGHRHFGSMRGPAVADYDTEPSLFSEDAGVTGVTRDQAGLEEKESASRVKRIWTKVRKWRAHS